MGGMLRWQSCSTSDFPLKPSKVATACQACRTKKMRCDGRQPCSRCVKDNKNCEYRQPSSTSHNNTRRSSNSDGNNNINKTKLSHTHTRYPSSPKFQWSKLKKLSFHQDLYAALNLSAAPLSTKSGKLPPLLLEFYHLTAQPITIWTKMHILFLKWYRLQKSPSLYSIRIPADVAKEAVHLFFKYNTLYTLFIDPADIAPALDLDPFFPSTITSTNTTVDPASSLLLDTILALTFLAAGQTIGSGILLDVARFFYDTVHQRWITMTFPSIDVNHHYLSTSTATSAITFKSSLKSDSNSNNDFTTNKSSSSLKLSIQTAILLIHFQCTAICEEQAYMTSRIAQGCLERLLSVDQIKSETQHQQQHDHTALQYALHAWQIWFALYLYDSQSFISSIAKKTSSVTPPSPPILPLSSSPLAQQQNQEQQLWTWTILTQYTMFMESILKANQMPSMTIYKMKTKIEALGSLSTINKESTATTSPTASTTCPEHLVGLYNTILTIQIFSTQWLSHLDFFTANIKLEQQELDQTDNGDNEDDEGGADDDVDSSKKICIETSQRILQMVSCMIMTGQYITAHRSSSPLLLFIRYRALCFASVILVSSAQQQWIASGSLSAYLDDSLHQLKQIIEKDIQIWPMARQFLSYLQQRMPSHFDLQDATTVNTVDGFLSNFDDMDGNNSFIIDNQQGRPFQTTTAAVATAMTTTAMMDSYSATARSQRYWHGNNRDHIDQEQLNKIFRHHDRYPTIKKRHVDQRNDALLYDNQQHSLAENVIYSRKRHQTYPAATTTTTSTTTNYWLSSYSLGGNNMGGPGSYLMVGNDGHSSMLLSVSSSTGSSASTSTALSVPSTTAPTNTTAMTASSKSSPSIATTTSPTFALSATPPMVPMPSTTYPTSLQMLSATDQTPLQQQAMCVSQSVMTTIPTTSISSTNNEENNNNNSSSSASFGLVPQSSTSLTYQQTHSMVQQQQTMTIGIPSTISSSILDTSNYLPSCQSSINNSNSNNKRQQMTWQYQSPSTRQLLNDTFTASIMETLHATHDQSIIHSIDESNSLPPAPTSSPVDTPTPSYLDDVHIQAVSRGLAHHASSMSLTRTTSVDSTATNNNNDLISNDDRHTQEWLYLLYQQQQRQHQQYIQQQPSPSSLHPPAIPSGPSTTASTDDPFMSFSSSLSSLARK